MSQKHHQKTQFAKQTRSGFTIVEFTLATAFIAVLLITIAIITNNIISIYQKGLTLKAVNSVGRGLVDELTESINAAPSVDTTSLCNSHVNSESSTSPTPLVNCTSDKANKFVYQQRLGLMEGDGDDQDGGARDYSVQLGGALCTGKYSYIWNTYYAKESGQYIQLRYRTNDEDDKRIDDARFMKIYDPTYRVCSAVVNREYHSCLYDPGISGTQKAEADTCSGFEANDGGKNVTIDIRQLVNGRSNPIPEPTQGFLQSFDLDLQLYELAIFPIAQDNITLRTFMSGTFILATERGNINISRAGNYCDVNQRDRDPLSENSSNILDIGSEFNYCGINKFNFAARTAGM